MKLVFIDCECGWPNEIAKADPGKLELFRRSLRPVHCVFPGCDRLLDTRVAYLGSWAKDGISVVRV